jgi:hypothetical protein
MITTATIRVRLELSQIYQAQHPMAHLIARVVTNIAFSALVLQQIARAAS